MPKECLLPLSRKHVFSALGHLIPFLVANPLQCKPPLALKSDSGVLPVKVFFAWEISQVRSEYKSAKRSR